MFATVDEWAEQRGADPEDVRDAIRKGALQPSFFKGVVRLSHTDPWPADGEGEPPLPCEAVIALRRYIAKWGADAAVRQLSGAPTRMRSLAVGTRRAVLERDGRVCQYCHTRIGPRTAFHIDHVVPVALGGNSELENLVICCVPCNYQKGTRPGSLCTYCGAFTWEGREHDHDHKVRFPYYP